MLIPRSKNKQKAEKMIMAMPSIPKQKCYNCSLTINISKKTIDGKDQIVYSMTPYYPKSDSYNSKEELYSDMETLEEALEKHVEKMAEELD